MIKITDRPTVYVDVDDTLIFWRDPLPTDDIVLVNNVPMAYCEKTVDSIIKHHHRKHPVVVWSAGGSDWAEAVVRALGLERQVSLVISKPMWIYDDKPSHMWIPESARTWHGDPSVVTAGNENSLRWVENV